MTAGLHLVRPMPSEIIRRDTEHLFHLSKIIGKGKQDHTVLSLEFESACRLQDLTVAQDGY